MNVNLDNKTVLTVRETAQYLGLAQSTLNKWRCHGGGPQYLKLGKAVRYRVEVLEEYLTAQSQQHTSEYEEPTNRRNGG